MARVKLSLASDIPARQVWRSAIEGSLDDAPDGIQEIISTAHAPALGLPIAAGGYIRTWRSLSGGIGLQEFHPYGNQTAVWTRRLGGTGWTAWVLRD